MLQLPTRQAGKDSPQALVLHEGCQALVDCSQHGSAFCSPAISQMTPTCIEALLHASRPCTACKNEDLVAELLSAWPCWKTNSCLSCAACTWASASATIQTSQNYYCGTVPYDTCTRL